MIEKQKLEVKSSKEILKGLEIDKIAETIGKYSKMRAKNGDGDKSGKYGHGSN